MYFYFKLSVSCVTLPKIDSFIWGLHSVYKSKSIKVVFKIRVKFELKYLMFRFEELQKT